MWRTLNQVRNKLLALVLLALAARSVEARAPLNALAVAPDGKTAICGGEAQELFVWSVDEKRIKQVVPIGTAVYALCWSPDSRLVAAGTRNGAQLWRTGVEGLEKTGIVCQECTILSASMAPDGETLALGVEGSGRLFFYSCSRRVEVGQLYQRSNLTSGMAFSPDGKVLITAGNSFTCWAVAAENWIQAAGAELTPNELEKRSERARLWVAPLPEPAEYAAAVAYSEDGRRVAGVNGTGGRGPRAGGRTLRIWDARTRRLLKRARATGMGCLTFLDGSACVATGADDGSITVWDTKLGASLKQWPAHRGEVRAIAALKQKGQVISAGEDGMLSVWQAGSGREISHVLCREP